MTQNLVGGDLGGIAAVNFARNSFAGDGFALFLVLRCFWWDLNYYCGDDLMLHLEITHYRVKDLIL